MKNETQETPTRKTVSCFKVCLLCFLLIISIIIIAIGFSIVTEYKQTESPATNIFVYLTKPAPEISAYLPLFPEFDEIAIRTKCNENYKIIEYELKIYDNQRNIIDKETFTLTNCKKNETYIKTYMLDPKILIKANEYECTITKYK